jgi:multiple sugar transport system ATP-binding protein
MSSIELRQITKKFGDFVAVRDLSIEIRHKEFVALLGPSGSGKTTTMNMIAGIETPTSGSIWFDGGDITQVSARRRGVGFVFQNYAIFTHMSVYRNLSFGLEVRRVAASEVERRVKEIARLVGLSNRLDWRASRLSMNEMQRLALGRSAIVNPNIFLLDEPLSNLEAGFRATMRTELKHLQRVLQQTMVYVTHDQLEAMSMADRIAVMNLGMLEQYETPLEVYNNPANTFVAQFIGSPGMNLVRCRITENASELALDFGNAGCFKVADQGLLMMCRNAPRPEVIYGIRPEHIAITRGCDSSQSFKLQVKLIEKIGARTIVHLADESLTLKVTENGRSSIRVTETVAILPHPGAHRLFDAQTGQAMR